MITSSNAFLHIGINLISKENAMKRKEGINKLKQNFRGSFGVSCDVASYLWEHLHAYNKLKKRTLSVHLLWALLFMKSYAVESLLTQIIGCSEKLCAPEFGALSMRSVHCTRRW